MKPGLVGDVRDLRPYCLGFGLFWAVPLLMLCGIPRILAPSDDWLTFVWTQQCALVVSLPLCSRFLAPRIDRMKTWLPFLAGGLLSTAGFLYVYCFTLGNSSTVSSVLTGVVLGLACALFYLLWQAIYANEGQRRADIYLPLAFLVTVAVCLALLVCPGEVVAVCLAAVLPCACSYTLWRSACDMVPLPARPVTGHMGSVLRDVWKPVLCASAVCFAWSLASHIPSLYDATLVRSMLVGLGAACLVVAAIGLFSTRDLGVFDVYQALFPVIGIVLFVPALLGGEWLMFLVGFLTFGARLMTLLVFMMAATYAARTQFSPFLVYLVCAFPLQAASFLGDSLGFLMVPQLADQAITAIQIPAACFVVCFAGLVVASLGKHPRSLAEPADDTLLINPVEGASVTNGSEPEDEHKGKSKATDGIPESEQKAEGDAESGRSAAFERIAEQADLSSREVEVVDLLLKGNTMAAISRKLFISENTTRGHMKRIYRKLGIHSRQELIDLFENGGSEDEKSA